MKKSIMPSICLALLCAGKPAAVVGAPLMEDASGVEKLLKQVNEELVRVRSDVRTAAEDALKQHKDTGTLTAEAKEAADKALTQYHGLSGALQKLEGKLEGLETRNLELEQSVAQGGRGGGGSPISVGQEVADSDALKNWIKSGLHGNLMINPKNAITSIAGSAGGLIWGDEERTPVGMPKQRLPIRALLNIATTESDVITYSRQTVRTNAAAITAEEGTAPESSYGWAKAEVNVRKIAHVTHISDEALSDAGQLQAEIDNEMRYGLDLEEEAQVLSGDGTGNNLSGLVTDATAFVAAAGLPNTTRIDRLRLGILQLSLGNYAANGITLNPTDWAAIELIKDTTGRYIFGNPNNLATPMLWGLDTIPTLSHSVGEWMAGNFKMAATLYDRQQNEILISSEHGTNFVDGMKTMKGTKRLALANKRPAALVTGDFTFV